MKDKKKGQDHLPLPYHLNLGLNLGLFAKVLTEDTGKFKHRDFGLAKKWTKFVVRKDVSLVLWVLKIVLSDVIPNFLNSFCAWNWASTDNCSKSS